MRVTFNTLNTGLEAINTAAEQFSEAQWQVSTGKRLRHLSTDPAGAQRAVVERTELATIDSYQRAGSAATSRLAALDQTLGDMIDQIIRARVAASSGRPDVASAETRAAAATTLAGIREAIAHDINLKIDGQYVFSGSMSNMQPYANGGGGWAYQGDAASVTAEVERGRRVTFTMDGRAILQGSDTTDVLSTIDTVITAVQAGDTAAIDAGIDALQRAFQRVTRAQSQIGTDQVSVDDSGARLQQLHLASLARVSKVEDANMAEAITRMTHAQTAYNAALAAVGTSGRNTLLDYLR
jgi:flagellar hook-associated protein 3 FlgL